MTFQDAVVQLEAMMGTTMISFESNQTLNGFDLYEFLVTKADSSKVMIHIGDGVVIEKGAV